MLQNRKNDLAFQKPSAELSALFSRFSLFFALVFNENLQKLFMGASNLILYRFLKRNIVLPPIRR